MDSEFGFAFKGLGRKLMETGEDSSVLVSKASLCPFTFVGYFSNFYFILEAED